jgi:hypothetical protein
VVLSGDSLRMLIVSVVFSEERDAEWALQTYRSVRFS